MNTTMKPDQLKAAFSTRLRPKTPKQHKSTFDQIFSIFWARFWQSGFYPLLFDPAFTLRMWSAWVEGCGKQDDTTLSSNIDLDVEPTIIPITHLIDDVIRACFLEKKEYKRFRLLRGVGKMITEDSGSWDDNWGASSSLPDLFKYPGKTWNYSSHLVEMYLAAHYIADQETSLNHALKIVGNPTNMIEGIQMFGHALTWKIFDGDSPPSEQRVDELASMVIRAQNTIFTESVQIALISLQNAGTPVFVTHTLQEVATLHNGNDAVIRQLRK